MSRDTFLKFLSRRPHTKLWWAGVAVFAALFFIPAADTSDQGTLVAGQSGRWTPELGRAPRAGEEYVNPADGSVLVWIPGGKFRMGSVSGAADERPVHELEVKGFWLGKFEVTNEQYQKFLKKTGWYAPAFIDEEDFDDPRQPVVAIHWKMAVAYVDWANLRLPTEAEWEYAARGGRNYEHPTSTGKLSHDLANYWGTGGRDKWLETPAPVGSFPANPFGIHDLAGNAWEWTSSIYRNYPYESGDGRENLSTKTFRVMRGGSWHFGAEYCTSSHRHRFQMHLRLDYVGIRVALTKVPGQN